MLHIVTDGSVDMPANWAAGYDIRIVPIPLQIGEKSYLQGVDITPEEFYRLVREKNLPPRTSLPSVGQFAEFYKSVAQPGDTILSLHVSSKLSGTFEAASMAARELASHYKIIPFDSLCGSAALGLMCREARLMERAGASLQDILTRLDSIRRSVSIIFTLDTLEFAQRSGRISALRAAVASILSIKPIIVWKEGLLSMGEMARTRGRALERVVELVCQRAGGQWVNVAVVHCLDPQAGQMLKARLCDLLHIKELILTELSIAVAANLGPGTIGIAVYPAE